MIEEHGANLSGGTSARPQNTKMYMGIFALLYYIIMGIQSEPLKTGKDDELKSRTDG